MAFKEQDIQPPSALSIENGKGEEIHSSGEQNSDQVVIATDSQGNSLTLLEEFAERRKQRVSPFQLALSFVCASASLAFAALIYFNTH